MKVQAQILTLVLASLSFAPAQTVPLAASHAPTSVATTPSPTANKPVARVNAAVLTELDLRRMMYSMFPYARQHNGVPKTMEAEVRKGALEMVIFEELLYQEANRRDLAIDAERLQKAQTTFRKQFADKAGYDQFLRTECK